MGKCINRCRCGADFSKGGWPLYLVNGESLVAKYGDSITIKQLFEETNVGKVGECGKCGRVFQIERVLFRDSVSIA